VRSGEEENFFSRKLVFPLPTSQQQQQLTITTICWPKGTELLSLDKHRPVSRPVFFLELFLSSLVSLCDALQLICVTGWPVSLFHFSCVDGHRWIKRKEENIEFCLVYYFSASGIST
jgi:hypothetical protein